MKYVDFSVQTAVLLAALIILLFNFGGSNSLLLVLCLQLIIGPWQLLSSVISVGKRTQFYKLKALHLVTSAVYLAILFSIPFDQLSRGTAQFIFMAPAWSLAIYYYTLTTISTFRQQTRQSSFLPHVSF